MGISEAARAELYTGLAEVLGRDRAETLMAYLPTFDPTDVATKGDVGGVHSEIDRLRGDMHRLRDELRSEMDALRTELRSEMDALRTELRSEMDALRTELRGEMVGLRDEMSGRFEALGQRLDRLFLTLVAGLFVIVAAMAGLVGLP